MTDNIVRPKTKLCRHIEQTAKDRGYSPDRAAEIEQIVLGLFERVDKRGYSVDFSVRADADKAQEAIEVEIKRVADDLSRQHTKSWLEELIDVIPDLCYPVDR